MAVRKYGGGKTVEKCEQNVMESERSLTEKDGRCFLLLLAASSPCRFFFLPLLPFAASSFWLFFLLALLPFGSSATSPVPPFDKLTSWSAKKVDGKSGFFLP